MHALLTDQFRDGVERRHQHHQCRDDASDEAGEDLAALLEDADEILADGGQPAKLLFLGNLVQLLLELFDGDRAAVGLRQNDKIVAGM